MKIQKVPETFKQPNFVQDKNEGGGFSGGQYEKLQKEAESEVEREEKEREREERRHRPGLKVVIGCEPGESIISQYSGEEFLSVKDAIKKAG